MSVYVSIAIIIAAASAVTSIIICSTSAASVSLAAAVIARSDINVVSRAKTRPKWFKHDHIHFL